MKVPVSRGGVVTVGTPRNLFSLSEGSEYEVMADGKFLLNEDIGQDSLPITVVLNWEANLGPRS